MRRFRLNSCRDSRRCHSSIKPHSRRRLLMTHEARIKCWLQKCACQTRIPTRRAPVWVVPRPRAKPGPREVALPAALEACCHAPYFCRHCHRAPRHLLTCAFVRELARVETWLGGSGFFTALGWFNRGIVPGCTILRSKSGSPQRIFPGARANGREQILRRALIGLLRQHG